MRKWEEKYKKIQSAEFSKRMEELQAKFDKKTITRDELKELESSKRKRDNIQKVDNVVEFRAKLEKQLREIRAEQDRRKKLSVLKRESRNLDFDLNTLKLKKSSVERDLKRPNLSDAEKQGLKQELLGLQDKINKNQELFSKNYSIISNLSNTKGKLTEISAEELMGSATNLSSKISKCNMICGKLVEGYSWDSIDMKLEQWKDREFKAPKGTADKMRNAADNEKKFDFSKLFDENGNLISENSKENGKETSLVEVSEFDQKHPRLAKIKNFFKKVGKNIKEAFVGEEPSKEENSESKEKDAKLKGEKDDFREYIKVVADKGMKEADRERLEAKKKAVQEKLVSQSQEKDNVDTGREPGDD